MNGSGIRFARASRLLQPFTNRKNDSWSRNMSFDWLLSNGCTKMVLLDLLAMHFSYNLL